MKKEPSAIPQMLWDTFFIVLIGLIPYIIVGLVNLKEWLVK